MAHEKTSSKSMVLEIKNGVVEPRSEDLERREFVRRPCSQWIGLITVGDDGQREPVTVRAENVSAGGLGAYAWEAAVGPAALLIRRADGEPELLGAEVVYCRQRSRLDYDLGLRFGEVPAGVSLEDFRQDDGSLLGLQDSRERASN
ncbi:MAG: PilZ domain-containing protein [Planctomycetota bacterium]|jgi:hypothetical protein